MAPLAETSLGDYERLMAMNASTCFLCCREAVRRIRQRGGGPRGGRLVNVTARPGLEPRTGAGMVAYATSKAAVAALTLALGEELAEERVWVNAVAPGTLDTAANRRAMPDADPTRWAPLAGVARTIVFLASPENTTTRCGLVPVYGGS
jgi:NAD(P)-dependent dehydrogenase (short-subunit alcohol dehydrogenase family)